MSDDEPLRLFTIWRCQVRSKDRYIVVEHFVVIGALLPGWKKTAPTLAVARRLVPPGRVRIPRSPVDDRLVVETWI
jgi:hypothetical protein